MNYSQAALCAKLSKKVYNFKSFEEYVREFSKNSIKFIDITTKNAATKCAIFPDSNKDILFIVFRGSEEWIDWSTNIDIRKASLLKMKKTIDEEIVDPEDRDFEDQDGSKKHRGFVKAYESVQQEIYDYLRSTSASNVSNVIVTGHSLGGALSTVCAFDIKRHFEKPLNIIVYTFGSPKVGNADFRKSFLKHVPNSYRFVYGMDIVSALPRPWQGYRHVEKEYRLGSRFSLKFISRRFTDHGISKYIGALEELASKE
ncbi:MAG: lipase family protein [Xenococcus sp. (in: cyanobacteria)]